MHLLWTRPRHEYNDVRWRKAIYKTVQYRHEIFFLQGRTHWTPCIPIALSRSTEEESENA
ncbi:hypothetical protein PAXRUDRAFT_351126 [Paxillus rubicundulus Ve08.2h10]|uniref:Uncharacterized protein n=1 Tax=Paxillus rubicundulus Ve08.2h10 TaxID=930991 RepID=A0A0D0E9K0_9AGAM|nr:hypothetical protein PAXRUDRAFT_351126 [Paxillus rubicundulus Ve08.2h10]